MFVEIKKSTNPKKKFMAIFYDDNKKKVKTIHFGSAGMSDFTIHKDKERKERYLSRHKKRENWTIPMTAGSLSRWLLWDNPDLQKSINAYMKRFKLKKY